MANYVEPVLVTLLVEEENEIESKPEEKYV
jgi:hypothetical protein